MFGFFEVFGAAFVGVAADVFYDVAFYKAQAVRMYELDRLDLEVFVMGASYLCL